MSSSWLETPGARHATQQADRVQRMAKRLSALMNLDKYAPTDDDIPMWRIHLFLGEQFVFANPHNAA
jgi:hypothetical protein